MKMIVEGPSSIHVRSKLPFLVLQISVQKQWGHDPCWGLRHWSPSLVPVRMEYLFANQFWYWKLWKENMWGGKRKHYFVNFFNVGGKGWCDWFYTPVCSYKFQALTVYYNPHLQYLQSEAHLKSSWTSAEELFRRNSQHVKVVGFFRRRAPSCIFDRMFDRILNATLSNNLL